MNKIEYGTEFLDQLKDKVHEQQEEIERLKEMKLHTEKYASEMEDKYILEKNKNNKAIEYIEQHNDYFLLKREVKELLNILKGVELTENDKKQVKWLKEEFKVGDDKNA